MSLAAGLVKSPKLTPPLCPSGGEGSVHGSSHLQPHAAELKAEDKDSTVCPSPCSSPLTMALWPEVENLGQAPRGGERWQSRYGCKGTAPGRAGAGDQIHPSDEQAVTCPPEGWGTVLCCSAGWDLGLLCTSSQLLQLHDHPTGSLLQRVDVSGERPRTSSQPRPLNAH